MINHEIARQVTGIVATHEREEELSQMIGSFRERYRDLRFIVADNSFTHYPRTDVEYLKLDADSGISLSRNRALGRVTTEYTLLVDDDLLRIDETLLEDLLEHLREHDFDIVAGHQRGSVEDFDFHGRYQRQSDLIFHYVGIPAGKLGQAPRYDVTPNFFIGRTSVLRALGGWDERLRFAKEHDDFFLWAKEVGVRIGLLPHVAVLNNSVTKHHGGPRGAACQAYFLEKWATRDKIEVRWIRSPHPRLSFYSSVTGQPYEPSREEFRYAMKLYASYYESFEVVNPFEEAESDHRD